VEAQLGERFERDARAGGDRVGQAVAPSSSRRATSSSTIEESLDTSSSGTLADDAAPVPTQDTLAW
jgi:hypothetical protein